MKKIVTIVLAVIMVMSLTVVTVFAVETTKCPITVVPRNDSSVSLALELEVTDGGHYYFAADVSEEGENLVKDFDIVSEDKIAGYLIDNDNNTVGIFIVDKYGSYDPTSLDKNGYSVLAAEVTSGDEKYLVSFLHLKTADVYEDLTVAAKTNDPEPSPKEPYEVEPGTGSTTAASQTATTSSQVSTQGSSTKSTVAPTVDATGVSKGATGDSANKLSSEVATAAGAPVVMYIIIAAAVVLAIIGIVVYKKRSTKI